MRCMGRRFHQKPLHRNTRFPPRASAEISAASRTSGRKPQPDAKCRTDLLAQGKAYCLTSDEFLKNKELFALVEVILGCRCFQKEDALNLITKLKRFTTVQDRKRLEKLIQKEVYHYHEVRSDCAAVIDTLWKLIRAIDQKRLVTITYYKMNREEVKRKIRPASVMFSEYYFYLIAYPAEDAVCEARYFRVDRITSMTEHREQFHLEQEYDLMRATCGRKTSSCSPARQRRSGFPFPAHPCRQSWTGFPPQKSWRKTVHSASSSGDQPWQRHSHVLALPRLVGQGDLSAESGARDAGGTSKNAAELF